MALINKFFPVKLRSSPSLNSKSDSCLLASNKRQSSNTRQRGILSQTQRNQRNSQILVNSSSNPCGVSNHNGSAQIRLLLFRECEVRGRRLLFDSGGGTLGDEGNGQQQIKDEFQELQMMKDMVFGSATLKYSGDVVRVHDFASTPWKGYDLMLSKVFPAPPAAQHQQPRTNNRSNLCTAPSGNGIGKVASATTADSGYTECSTNESRSECWSSGSSFATATASGVAPSSASASRTSFGSVSLAVPRIPEATRNAVSDSLLNQKTTSSASFVDGRQLNSRSRKVRLAIALLFSDRDQAKKELPVRDLAFDHFSLVEHFIQRLQHNVLRAYYSRNNFPALMQEAIRLFGTDLGNVRASISSDTVGDLNADIPVYLPLASPSPFNPAAAHQVAQRFMTNWESVIAETDTKLTHFFWSSLLSAVLTYHVNWLYSFVREPVDFSDCGTRVLVLSKDVNLAQRLLHILSYFVRTSGPFKAEAAATSSSPSTQPSSSNIHSPSKASHSPSSPSHSNGVSKSLKEQQQVLCNKDQTPDHNSASFAAAGMAIQDCANSAERRITPARRSSQQLADGNTRYLRNYYDVRFQLSPDTIIAKRDGKAFANLISSIAKNDFQLDFSLRDHPYSPAETEPSCGFFVGSIPDRASHSRHESPPPPANGESSTAETRPIVVPNSSLSVSPSSVKKNENSRLNRWFYRGELRSNYEAGRTLQSCDPSLCDWLHELQLDLRAASACTKSVSCIVANTETWEIQVLTCTQEENCTPPRIKQYWVPVTMSGQVAALVESTQLLWLMMRNASQCLDHLESRLRLLCQKSEDLGGLLSTSIGSWNVDRVTHLLDVETGDLPLLMAACSVHSPSVASMGGVTMMTV